MSGRTNRVWIGVVSLFVVICSAHAWAEEAAPPVELLWPDGAPGATGDAEGDKPTLTVFLPPKEHATGVSVVICPGGGYHVLAMDHEGYAVAKWLNSFGVAGFVLKYRHRGTGYGYPAPMLDAKRAVRMVRARAEEWKLNPGRIGIMGFSAGGHLASTVGTHFDNGRADATDSIDKVSCRPDFMVLVYPVISFVEAYTHEGTKKNLLGDKPDPKLLKKLSNERHITSQTPPTFLVHTNEDSAVPAENSMFFFLALRRAHIAVEMHIFARGPHGFGLGKKGEPHAMWPKLCELWMKRIGLIKSDTP